MNLIIIFFSGILTGLSGSMIPGPLFLFTVSESLKKDAKVGLKIAFGHIIIEGLLIALIFLGLKNFLQTTIFIKSISIIGAVALMGMGIILIRKSPSLTLSVNKEVNFNYGVVGGGIFFSAISPGFIIWWATIGASVFLRALLSGIVGLIVLALGHWLADLVWHWFISFSVNKGKQYLSDALYRKIMQSLALGLILMGIFFLMQFFRIS